MENRNKIILGLLIVLTIVVVSICVYFLIDSRNVDLSDSTKFRNEYMELNDKINESNGKAYPNVLISEINTVKYATENEIIELLENGTGVIYFGFSTCPWCRSLISTLTSIAENKSETIYYLDILNIRSSFEIKDGKLDKIKNGTKGYYKILELLDDVLDDFYLVDNNNRYDTEEKRLYAPTVIAVQKGEITDIHVGTVSSQESGYDKLTNDQITELEDIIRKLIDSKNQEEKCTQEAC